jgi:hypothetical protein
LILNLFYFMSIYQDDTHAVFETFLSDLQDGNLSLTLQGLIVLNKANSLGCDSLVQSKFCEQFKD